MYTRQEAAQIRQAFWTAFGQYMAPLPSASGERVRWVNYKTGVPGISFKMDADNRKASIGIVLSQKDDTIRLQHFEQLEALRGILEPETAEAWTWEPFDTDDYGQPRSRIYTERFGLNIMRQADWPELISFFKPRILALDRFWDLVRDGFA